MVLFHKVLAKSRAFVTKSLFQRASVTALTLAPKSLIAVATKSAASPAKSTIPFPIAFVQSSKVSKILFQELLIVSVTASTTKLYRLSSWEESTLKEISKLSPQKLKLPRIEPTKPFSSNLREVAASKPISIKLILPILVGISRFKSKPRLPSAAKPFSLTATSRLVLKIPKSLFKLNSKPLLPAFNSIPANLCPKKLTLTSPSKCCWVVESIKSKFT